VDWLPGSLTFDPAAGRPPSPEEAAAVVWLDALLQNVDRDARNPNLLVWHRQLWLIDHGAALYFHHAWEGAAALAVAAFPQVRRHVLLPFAGDLRAAGARLAAPLRAALPAAVAEVPEAWLAGEGRFPDAATHREAYVEHLSARLDAAPAWEEDAERARASVV
jgi:hypothetical protein